MNVDLLRQDKFFTTSDGVGIHYQSTFPRTHTGKPWLILLHGMGGDLRAWSEEVRDFTEAGYHSIAVDVRGHGLSGRPIGLDRYKLSRIVQDINELIAYERIENPVIVGHCMGGMIGMTYAATYSDAKELVLVDTSYRLPSWGQLAANHEFVKHVLGLIIDIVPSTNSAQVNMEKFIGGPDYSLQRIYADILNTSLRSYLSICDQLLEFDGRELLSRISVPTLVIDGEQDSVFPPEYSRELASRIKRSELDLIPGANHILVLNNPDELAAEVLKFVGRA